MSSLILLGWNEHFSSHWNETNDDPGLSPARVVAEHRGEWSLLGERGARRGVLSGRLRREAGEGLARPGVGDWVAARIDDEDAGDGEALARIERVLPRSSVLARKAPGEASTPQLVAANVELVVLVAALDGNFNPRRLERHAAAVLEGGAQPFVLLNKADLVEDAAAQVEQARRAVPGARVELAVASADRGLDGLRRALAPGLTACLIGSSGVGKSTTLNALSGDAVQATGAVRASDRKGRHVTTHRQLFSLPGGALLIDTPGMREFSPWSEGGGEVAGFAELDELAVSCRFADCAHAGEPGCAVSVAVDAGELDADRLASWEKLRREMAFEATRHDARARAEHRKHWRTVTKARRHRPDKRW